MSILSLVLGLAGGICGLLGIFTGLGVLPGFIEAEEAIGPIVATTGFLWGLALLFLVASIAISVGRGSMDGSPFD
jgi:hypothetical protein